MTNKTHEQLMETNAVYRKLAEGPPVPMAGGYATPVQDARAAHAADALAEQEGGDHYKGRKMQPVEYIEANELPFLEGCIIKRATRHGQKNGVEDLKKIIHEARLIAQLRYGVDI